MQVFSSVYGGFRCPEVAGVRVISAQFGTNFGTKFRTLWRAGFGASRDHPQAWALRRYVAFMTEGVRIREIEGEKARRRAARELIANYHEKQLRPLLEHVRDGLRKLDAGEIDPFELDELIHRYKRSTQKLWSFCGSSGSGWESAALTLEWWREHGEEEPDWWEAGAPRRRRR